MPVYFTQLWWIPQNLDQACRKIEITIAQMADNSTLLWISSKCVSLLWEVSFLCFIGQDWKYESGLSSVFFNSFPSSAIPNSQGNLAKICPIPYIPLHLPWFRPPLLIHCLDFCEASWLGLLGPTHPPLLVTSHPRSSFPKAHLHCSLLKLLRP